MAARLTYRQTHQGREWASWVRELRGRSGVYVIRRRGGSVLYIGESHTGRLKETLQRHFQHWHDSTGREHFRTSPGDVEVAVRFTPPGAAIGHQDRLISRYKPKHNIQGAEWEVPF